MKATRTRFYCRLWTEDGQQQIATSIQVIVPAGLTREQAVDYVTGRIAGEIRRYAAYEALGLSYTDHHTNWSEIVT